MTRRSSILDDALRLRGLPVSVIPIAGNKKPPARFSWKRFQSELADEAKVRDWFAGRDDLGLAIVLGPVSGGLYARDFDQLDAYRHWADSHKSLAKSLPTVITKRGRHVYARCESARSTTIDDGELRANGLYVVAPHSPHPDGGSYRWAVPIRSLGSIPVVDPVEAGFVLQDEIRTDRTERQTLTDQSDLSYLSYLSADFIQNTIPSRFGTRNRRLFDLARKLRAHSEWTGIPLSELRPLLQEWHRQALPFIRTKEFSETWSDFVIAYEHVDLERSDAVVAALEQMDSSPLPDVADQHDSDIVRRLIGLCFRLSCNASNGVFYVSCRKAASALGTQDYQAVARYLKMLCAERVIAVVEQGGPHNNRATRYRWIGGPK